ncbi:hypothetical protein [Chitinophaga sancti]|uniref:Outer membrane protein beta-barrel domain-containing protein n=1 Tax=Chitinophaga sancti TaxID=1004 RepID=A0A1K1LW24_9BACT|nr:hypothetical protein [Chitinophaga sancti]WQD64795.1 hypothetical protein U0033_10350 [Chitinophaga sancti]WQG89581.1 hypothetical protein SR876_32120 [Chitinophaga sancti]SFW15133.1 hypothetical protein SAMN05661012_00270 [Chitinophaga sancti]
MKKALLALLVLISVQQAWAQTAQTETLFSKKSGSTKFGAYGVPAANLTSIGGNFAVMTGGYGGIFINKKWMFGAGAYSLVNNITSTYAPSATPGLKQYLNFWYTGLAVEYTHNTDQLIHWTAGALVGGGAVARRNKETFNLDDNEYKYHTYDRSGLFVAEPFANIELNVTSYLRLDLGATYRFVQGSNTPNISNGDLSMASFHFGIKAGKF